MPLLQFTLSEEGVHALRDALACLSKFNEEVSLEAKKDRVGTPEAIRGARMLTCSPYSWFSRHSTRPSRPMPASHLPPIVSSPSTGTRALFRTATNSSANCTIEYATASRHACVLLV